jgi:hypothetical protein
LEVGGGYVGVPFGDAVDDLFEVGRDGEGEVVPPGAPDGVGALVAVEEVGVAGFAGGGDEGDAAPAVGFVLVAFEAGELEVAASGLGEDDGGLDAQGLGEGFEGGAGEA